MRTNAPVLITVCALLACSSGSSRAAPEPPAAPAPAPAPPAPAAAPAPPAPPAATPVQPTAQPAAPPEAAAHAPKLLDLQVPELKSRVTDLARVFSPSEVGKLKRKLAAHEKATGRQFAVLTWKDLEGRAIEDLGFTIANTWKLGDAQRNDGVLIVIAPNDRKVRIEVGTGLEQTIPDELAAQIIAEQMAPEFRKGKYGAGVTAALDQLFAAARRAK